MLDQDVVNVLASKMRVATGCHHSEGFALDLDHGDIEGATTEVIHQYLNFFLCLSVQSIGHRCSRRFIDYVSDVKTSNSCSILGRLFLLKIEVGGDGHYRILDLRARAAVSLCDFLHLF